MAKEIIESKNTKAADEINKNIPLLPLKDVVVFPHTVIPLFVGRKSSIESVLKAISDDKKIFLITQKNPKQDTVDQENLYKIGVIAKILQFMRMPDGSVKILVEGEKKGKIANLIRNKDGSLFVDIELVTTSSDTSITAHAMSRSTVNSFKEFAKYKDKVPSEIIKIIEELEDLEQLTNIITANLNFTILERQEILEEINIKKIFDKLLLKLQNEIQLLKAEQKIDGDVRSRMDENHRDYYLNEKLKSIKKELGAIDDESEISELKKAIKKAKMPKYALKKANEELKKLERISPSSSDYPVLQNYIETLCKVPWSKKTKTNKDLNKAQESLDADHCGLEKVKERILEHLAVQKRVAKNNANILCLIGPPGVGKTSLGKSIADSLNRKYVRMALGGVRDEAEIRGHRKTYIGAMPGTIISKMQKAGVVNPLFLLDEVDKIASDFRGDPASALLEVLDPEQNNSFADHYLEVDYDLSQVMFVATANTMNMPDALLDRMEIIHLEGYTENEKLDIATQHLVKSQIKNNGLKNKEISISNEAIIDIVRFYTREAGVRGLNREIEKICRKVLIEWTLEKRNKIAIISSKNLVKYLGVKKYRFGIAENKNQIGEVTGLAWTRVGGDLLTIEANTYAGKGKLNYTGQLGEVMQESIKVAMSVIRSRAEALNIDKLAFEKQDIDIHAPDGATPKDGPSAGAAIATAISSVLTNRKVRADVAMTGEITLRGEITPIGGLKEKLLAALRGGIKTVLIPYENERELSEVPNIIKDSLKIVKVKWIEDVLDIALEKSK